MENRIKAIRAPSKFVSEPHLAFAVDDVPLDELLNSSRPELQLTGLVSSLLGWFYNDDDSAIAWQRILPEIGCTSHAPVLICPDDLDYSCTVVMAEVVAEADFIGWNRLGLDFTHNGVVGASIRWEPGLGPFRFRRADYVACLAAFRIPETKRITGANPDSSPAF